MKKSSIFKIVMLMLFISFLGLYMVSNSSYYDYTASKKNELTKEEINKFEEMIKNGEKIDLDSYYKSRDRVYDNKVSNLSLKLSNTIGDTFELVISKLFSSINGIVNKK